MFYIIIGGTVCESQSTEPTQAELQALANQFDDSVYVIVGEHAGLSAEPAEPVPVAADYTPQAQDRITKGNVLIVVDEIKDGEVRVRRWWGDQFHGAYRKTVAEFVQDAVSSGAKVQRAEASA